MNIVVLDGYTMNPGDMSWDLLEKLGNCTVYPSTAPNEVVKRAKDAEIILTNKVVISKTIIAQLPKLKYIGVLATGYNVVEINAAKERGITVTNVPAYSTQSVAQFVFAHILNLTFHVGEHSQDVKSGAWRSCSDFCFWNFPLIEISDLTLGIIGFGKIGREVAKIANSFGMKVVAHSRSLPVDLPEDVKIVSLDNLLSDSDIITLHCPLTDNTKEIISIDSLVKMKKSSFLINTSRGGLINEFALADALNTGIIAGAGLDVLSKEPPSTDSPLMNAKNCYLTPHIAWASISARKRLMRIVVENVRAFINGTEKNVICYTQTISKRRF